jgi:GPR1/FUN34/yaaH family
VKSTVAFFSLFFTLDLAFLCLGIAYLQPDAAGSPNKGLTVAGGVFGILTAFLAWYNALAGIADTSNRYAPHSVGMRSFFCSFPRPPKCVASIFPSMGGAASSTQQLSPYPQKTRKPSPSAIKIAARPLFSVFIFTLCGNRELGSPLHSFFIIPVAHFPWSEKGRERRGLSNNKGQTA